MHSRTLLQGLNAVLFLVLSVPTQVIFASPLDKNFFLDPREISFRSASILDSRAVTLPGCLVSVWVDFWASCSSVRTQYELTLGDFVLINPSVGPNCENFRPGNTYCVLKSSVFPISQDGRCGSNSLTVVICIGSTYGPCCANSGTCGSINAFCGLNCESGACIEATPISSITSRPLLTPRTPSPDGSCGFRNRYICNGINPAYQYGNCCSAAGYCGSDQYYCDSLLGCQEEFGLCDKTKFVTVTQLTTTSASPTTTAAPIVTLYPIIAGMVSNCDKFKYINIGETCKSLAAMPGMALSDFMKFNPGLPPNCVSGWFFGWYVCVSIPGHELGAPYNVTEPASPQPTHLSTYSGFRLWGCATGYTSVHLVLTGRYADDFMTVEKCLAFATAQGSKWAGIEAGWICRYGNAFVVPAGQIYPAQVGLGNCYVRCYGDTETFCGGYNYMSIYEKM